MITSQFLSVFIIFKLFEKGCAFLPDTRCYLSSSADVSMKSFVDFSSAMEWDEFYKKPENYDSIASEGGSPSTETRATATATEWHSSICLDDIASRVPPNGKCLVIGCGNSNLPDRILKQQDQPPPRSLVLLDTSQTCLDQLRKRYESVESSTKIEYVCGDVTKLSNYFGIDNIVDGDERIIKCEGGFDIIIDKGLTDAILCGEGWDGPLEKLFYESAKVLSMETGQYLLISYQLPSSTKGFLMDVGNKVGLEWDFDFELVTSSPSSEESGVSVAMAKKKKEIV